MKFSKIREIFEISKFWVPMKFRVEISRNSCLPSFFAHVSMKIRIFLWKFASFYEKCSSWFSMKIRFEIRWEFGIPHFRAPQAQFPRVRLVVVVNFVGVRCVRKSGFEGTSGNEFRCEALETHFVLFCSLEIWSRTFERILGFLWALSRS